jgi:hypothetical protein
MSPSLIDVLRSRDLALGQASADCITISVTRYAYSAGSDHCTQMTTLGQKSETLTLSTTGPLLP